MKAQDYRSMDEGALREALDKHQREVMDLRCQISLGEEVHPHRIRTNRREIARMMTVMNEKQRAAEAAAAGGESA